MLFTFHRFFPVRREGQTMTGLVKWRRIKTLPEHRRASDIIMTASTSMRRSFTSLGRVGISQRASTYFTTTNTSMRCCRTVSRDPTWSRSRQSGASPASILSPYGRTLCKSWSRWVGSSGFSPSQLIPVELGDILISIQWHSKIAYTMA